MKKIHKTIAKACRIVVSIHKIIMFLTIAESAGKTLLGRVKNNIFSMTVYNFLKMVISTTVLNKGHSPARM